MKLIIYLASVGLAGIVVGVVATQVVNSPNPEESAESSVVADAKTPSSPMPSADATPNGERRTPNRLLRDLAERNGSSEVPDVAEDPERQEEVRNAMRERQMERFSNQAAKWSAALGLDEGQQEQLLDVASDQVDELENLAVEGMDSDDPSTISTSARRAMEILSGQALESSLSEMLTPDQRETFEDFSNRQNASRAESRALRQLAGLNDELMLTPDQRNEVYGVYYDRAIDDIGESDPLQGTIDNLVSSAGVSIDPAMQNIITSMGNRGLDELASGRSIEPEAVQNMANEAMQQSLDGEVNRLRGILNEAQLEIYRNQLRSQMETLTGGSISE